MSSTALYRRVPSSVAHRRLLSVTADSRPTSLTRRHALVAAASLLAGCGRPSYPDLRIENERSTAVSLTVTITHDESGDRLLRDTTDIAAGETRTYADPVDRDGPVAIRIELADGPTASHRWPAQDEGSSDSAGVTATVTDDDIAFTAGGT